MASVPQFSNYGTNGQSQAFNVTNYLSLFAGSIQGSEASVKVKYRSAGVLSRFSVLIGANTIATSATAINFRKNGGAGNMVLSIPAGSTGEFQDLTNTDTITAGDDVNCQIVTPNTSGSITIRAISTVYAATTDTVVRYSTRHGFNNSNGITQYNSLSGEYIFDTNEANVQTKFRAAGTIKNLYCEIEANPRSTTTLIRTRINGANGNCLISIGAGVTGQFEDTSNSDTVASGDLICTSYVMGASGELLNPGVTSSIEFVSTASQTMAIAETVAPALAANITRFFGVGGGSHGQATESNTSQKANVAFTASQLNCFVSSNTVVGTSVFTLRKNGANANCTLSIPSLTTGFFEDVSSSDIFTATDTINTQIVTGATGTSLTMATTHLLISIGVDAVTNFNLPLLGVG